MKWVWWLYSKDKTNQCVKRLSRYLVYNKHSINATVIVARVISSSAAHMSKDHCWPTNKMLMYTHQRCSHVLSPVYSLHCLHTMEPLQFLTYDTVTAECGWEFSSVVERLPSTCKTLGSNPSTDWQESRAYYNSPSTAQVFLPNWISCSFTAGKKKPQEISRNITLASWFVILPGKSR